MPVIRITEIRRSALTVVIEVEGYLTPATVEDVRRTLDDYASVGFEQACIGVDHLDVSNDLVLQALCRMCRDEMRLRFTTSRRSLYIQLSRWASDVQLKAADGRDPAPDSVPDQWEIE